MRINFLATLALGASALVAVGVQSSVLQPAAPPATTRAAFSTVAGLRMNSFEARILTLTNSARANAGVAPLSAVAGTTDVARRWAYEQARSLTMKHNPALVSSMVAAGSSGWHYIAENVGVGVTSDPDGLFRALMNSPHHRENLLDPRSHFIGIGAVEKLDVDGNLYTYLTQDFVDSYTFAYGTVRVAATGLSRDAWRPLLGRLLAAILPGDQHEDVNVVGGVKAGTVSFTHAIGGYAAVVAVSDGGSTGRARIRYHDAIDYRAIHGIVVTLATQTASGASLPVTVDFRNPATGVKSGSVQVNLNGRATTVRIPLPSGFRAPVTEIGVEVTRDAIVKLSGSVSKRYARVMLINVGSY